MNRIRLFLGRRQFLIAFMSSALAVAFGKVTNAFEFLFKANRAKAAVTGKNSGKKSLKGIVVYYSATGSTAKIADAVYQGMKTVMDCDVAPMDKVEPEDMAKYDVIAVGAPTWYYRVPANVKIFLNHLPRMEGKFGVLFTTHGTQPVGTFWDMSRSMLKKGIAIIGWDDWYGDCTHMLQSAQPYVTQGHPDRIDLDEAGVFGREMAERAGRIAAGEANLVPDVPTPVTGDNEQGGLWAPHKVIRNLVFGEIIIDRPGGPIAHEMPSIDLTKCLYPRCTECMDTCPVNAIDHRMAAPAVKANDTKPIGTEGATLVVKEACQHCGGYCQRVCVNDAISYVGLKTLHAIDMTKCIYPKCTLCRDECMMDAIDFSHDPPVFHDRCEGCDLCWCICPVEGALVITNLEKSHLLQIPAKNLPADIVEKYNIQDTSGQAWSPGEMFSTRSRPLPTVGQDPAGPGGASMMMNMKGDTPWDMPPKIESMEDFRLLIPEEDIGGEGYPLFSDRVPRIVLNKEDWPYDVI